MDEPNALLLARWMVKVDRCNLIVSKYSTFDILRNSVLPEENDDPEARRPWPAPLATACSTLIEFPTSRVCDPDDRNRAARIVDVPTRDRLDQKRVLRFPVKKRKPKETRRIPQGCRAFSARCRKNAWLTAHEANETWNSRSKLLDFRSALSSSVKRRDVRFAANRLNYTEFDKNEWILRADHCKVNTDATSNRTAATTFHSELIFCYTFTQSIDLVRLRFSTKRCSIWHRIWRPITLRYKIFFCNDTKSISVKRISSLMSIQGKKPY